MRPIAADLTGTYDTHPELKGEVDLIITGESWENYNEIIDTTEIDVPVFWNPGDEELMDIVEHKANVINKTNASKFYEDQSVQVNLLKGMCPNCRIILVREGLFSI